MQLQDHCTASRFHYMPMEKVIETIMKTWLCLLKTVTWKSMGKADVFSLLRKCCVVNYSVEWQSVISSSYGSYTLLYLNIFKYYALLISLNALVASPNQLLFWLLFLSSYAFLRTFNKFNPFSSELCRHFFNQRCVT